MAPTPLTITRFVRRENQRAPKPGSSLQTHRPCLVLELSCHQESSGRPLLPGFLLQTLPDIHPNEGVGMRAWRRFRQQLKRPPVT